MADSSQSRQSRQQGQGPLEPWQRYTEGRTCPICGGRTDLDQSDPERCWGYLVSNGRGAYCSTVESKKPHREWQDQVWWHPLLGAPEGPIPNGHGPDSDYTQYLVSQAEGTGIRAFHYYDVDGSYLRTKYRLPNGQKTWDKQKGLKVNVPYRVKELTEAAKLAEPVWVTDGERDVEALVRAGVVATCGPNGMGAWSDELSRHFQGVPKVTIVQDRDSGAGAKGARKVQHSLASIVPDVVIVQAAKGHKDAHDHLRAHLKLEDFVEVTEPSTWSPVDLGPVIRGEQVENPPTILARNDGPCLIYQGKVHNLYGEPEAGKGWVALAASAEQLEAGEFVVYIDFEADAATVVSRLRSLQVPDDAILERFIYIRPDEPLEFGEDDLLGALDDPPALVVLDGLTEALALEDVDIVNNTGVANWIREMPRRIAHTTGAGILIIDHVPHEADRMIGAQHKKAGIDVAYHMRAIDAFGRGQVGKATIKVTKDRPGHVRPTAIDPKLKESDVAEVILQDLEPGVVLIDIRTPVAWAPLRTMEDVSKRLEAQDGLSTKQLMDRVSGRDKIVKAAVNVLEERGFLRREPGPRNGTYHWLVKPFRAEQTEQ